MEFGKTDIDVAEYVSELIVEEIIDQGGELLYEHYIEGRSFPFTINTVLSTVENALEVLYLRHDEGEPEEWTEDSEFIPCKIDTWARNAIPSRRKVKIRVVNEPTSQMAPLENRSIKSFRSTINKNPKIASRNTAIAVIDEDDTRPAPIENAFEEISEEEELMRQRKERQNKRKKEEVERMKKMKEEESEKQKKLSKETEELKKKPFTYDSEGNIVMINTIKYEKLPPPAMSAKFAVPDITEMPKPKEKRELGNPKVKKPVPTSEQDFVKNMTAVQPPLFESIKLNPGVGMYQGNQSKFTPMQAIPGQTMTRQQYQQLAKRQETQLIPQTPMEASEVREHSIPSQETPRESLAQSRKNILEGIPDYDVTGHIAELDQEYDGAKPMLRKSMVNQQTNKIIAYSKGMAETDDMGPVERFNLEIMKNRNWGINPPVKQAHLPERLPKRPSEKNVRATHGDILKKPKDQPFISPNELWEAQGGKLKRPRDRPYIERVGQKTRMPAPPFGKTMVHVEDRMKKSASESLNLV